MTKKIDELKAEATELGISYSPNIGEAKLQEKIDNAKPKAEVVEGETEEPSWMEKAATKTEAEEKAEVQSGKWGPAQRRKLAAKREAEARKTRIITIIDNDQRVNNKTTSAVVTCGNEMFDLGTAILPLNMDVEVMQGHIDVLTSIKIPQHIAKQGSNGLSEVAMRPRYTISYSDKKPS